MHAPRASEYKGRAKLLFVERNEGGSESTAARAPIRRSFQVFRSRH